jgi:hypothetical protein
MISEEQYLRNHVGKANPFRVPEGYFDNFTSQLMEKLPEKPASEHIRTVEPPTLLLRLRPLLAVAACLLVAILTVALYFNKPESSEEQLMAAQETMTDTYFDEATDYAMVDNYDIYACLASE